MVKLPNNLFELIGFIIGNASVVFSLLTIAKWAIERIGEISEKKYNARIKEAEAKVEEAKVNSLSAVQVTNLLKQIYDFKVELEDMKVEDEKQAHHFGKSIDRLEGLLDGLTNKITDFLISKIKQ